VVVVSNDRPLVGRIQELGVSNLCAISLAELNRWVRQQAVARALGRLPRPPLPATPLSSRPSARPPSPVSQGSRGSPLGLTPAGVQKALALVWVLAFFSAAGLLAWRWLDPKGSEGLWRQLPLSRIPWLRDRSSPNRAY
jgi:hypothetical protein